MHLIFTKMFSRMVILILCCVSVLKLVSCDIYRLPKNVKPIRYILTVEPFLHQDLFHGNVTVEMKILESTSNITLHENGIHIPYNDIKIVNRNGSEMQLSNVSENNQTETYTIFLETKLLRNNCYNLTISNFSRKYGDNLGFLLKHLDGDSHASAAVTLFQQTGARLVFPCFDEPALRAIFVVNLIRKEGYYSASNEALERTEKLGDGRFKDTFKETPPMPTYTVEFIVSNFKLAKIIQNQRVFGPSKTIDGGELDKMEETGIKALQALEDYTGINYTLSKIDHFVVPDFPVGAMENWGLITYNEMNVKIENESDAEQLQRMTTTVTHEMAHQWFGNLVTPEWWNYLWLSESFACYFQYKIASIVQPSWRLMDQMVLREVQTALYKEEHTSAGALSDPISRSGDMPLAHIIYPKGAAILRMTEHFLTHDVFRNGIQIYLQNNKFSSAAPSDLYSALQEAVDNAGANNLLGNMSVADILTTWDSTKGFPIVTVTRNYLNGSVWLAQHQSSDDTQPRIIPITYVFSSAVTANFSTTITDYWLKEENAMIGINFPTDGWVIVNIQQTGYYRVNYDLENWERIIDYMNNDDFTSIHVLNRAQLINDAFYLGYNKIIPWHIPLRLGQYLKRERNYIPFSAFYNVAEQYIFNISRPSFENEFEYFSLSPLFNTLSEYDKRALFYREYVHTTLSDIREYLRLEGEPNVTHLDKLNQQQMEFQFWKDV